MGALLTKGVSLLHAFWFHMQHTHNTPTTYYLSCLSLAIPMISNSHPLTYFSLVFLRLHLYQHVAEAVSSHQECFAIMGIRFLLRPCTCVTCRQKTSHQTHMTPKIATSPGPGPHPSALPPLCTQGVEQQFPENAVAPLGSLLSNVVEACVQSGQLPASSNVKVGFADANLLMQLMCMY